MKILVVNAGSSSLKYQLLDMKTEKVIAKGNCEKIGLKCPFITYKHDGKSQEFPGANNHEEAIEKVIAILTNKEYGVIKTLDEIDAVAHRVVSGGYVYRDSQLITAAFLKQMEKLIDFAPLHNPAHIKGMLACRKVMPKTPQVAVFDTAFHSTMPEYAYNYAIDYKDAEKFHVRKYGAHGSSHRFITNEAAKVLGKKVKDVNLIVAHLGNGSSLTAVKNGQSVDTSMGFSPLQGVVMGTRSGDIDPAAVQYLCHKKKMDIDEALTYLNKKCGLLGISGYSDQRDIEAQAAKGDKNCKLALDMFYYSVKKYVGSYMAVLNKVDAIVFTGGVGENGAGAREAILSDMEELGVVVDKKKNANFKRGEIEEISSKKSKVRIFIIPTNEELMMARETQEIVKSSKKAK